MRNIARSSSYATNCLIQTGARLNRMELNGALSNPQAALEVSRLRERCATLIRKAIESPRSPTPIPVRTPPVSEIVSRVLADAARPMRACEVHRAAESAFGASLRWKSVKAALAAGAGGASPRFERVAYGLYRALDRCALTESAPT